MGQKRKRFQNKIAREACLFCGKDENNEVLYGRFFQKNDINIHEYCMFFASGLVQRGSKDSDGILRFRIPDIKEEASRGQKLKCVYCKKYGATVGCFINNCRKSYHFPCGVKYRTLNQHSKEFPSYCHVHKPSQKVAKMSEELYCHICCTSLSKDDLKDCLYSPCCKKNWFHRFCLQKYALSAGLHFFKCPLCNNSAEFMKEMQEFGICIPDKDASWELDTNAYRELLDRPECGATDCECTEGRKYDGEEMWDLLPCEDCGADARHKHCGGLSMFEISWMCDDCKTFEETMKSGKRRSSGVEETTECDVSDADTIQGNTDSADTKQDNNDSADTHQNNTDSADAKPDNTDSAELLIMPSCSLDEIKEKCNEYQETENVVMGAHNTVKLSEINTVDSADHSVPLRHAIVKIEKISLLDVCNKNKLKIANVADLTKLDPNLPQSDKSTIINGVTVVGACNILQNADKIDCTKPASTVSTSNKSSENDSEPAQSNNSKSFSKSLKNKKINKKTSVDSHDVVLSKKINTKKEAVLQDSKADINNITLELSELVVGKQLELKLPNIRLKNLNIEAKTPLTPSANSLKTEVSKAKSHKKQIKKTKKGCCSAISNHCIRKYFGLECQADKL